MKKSGPHQPPIARLLVQFRRSRGITGIQFAGIAGMNYANLARYEAGLQPVGPENYRRIEEAIAKIRREDLRNF